MNYDTVYIVPKIHLKSGICMNCRWENNLFCFDIAFTAKGKAILVGPGFDGGSESATRLNGSNRSWGGGDESRD